jgi:hypothetical protein
VWDWLEIFDWFTPLSALIGEFVYGGATMQIDYDTLDMPANTLRAHLAAQGIRTWGWGRYRNMVTFSYREADYDQLWEALHPTGGLHAPVNRLGCSSMLGTVVMIPLMVLILLAGESVWGNSLIPCALVAVVGMLTTNGGLFFGALFYFIAWLAGIQLVM